MNQLQFIAQRDFWAQRKYTLRFVGLRANGENQIGFEENLLNVSVFVQRQARHELLTVNDWKAFWREVDTDLYLDSERLDLDEDDNIHHHHDHDHDHDRNHRHDTERNGRNGQLDLGRSWKRRRVISSESSGNGQNNDDWAEGLHREMEIQQLRQFRVFYNRREKVLPPVQTATGAPVQVSILRTAQEDAIRRVNNICPNLDEESSVSWISAESINQEKNTPFANIRTAQQLFAAQDNQKQLNLQVNKQIQQKVNQLNEVNTQIQIPQQDDTINNTQNEQRQQIDVIRLKLNSQQNKQNIPINEQGDTNNENQQFTQTGATHTLQTEAPDNLQHQQTGQNDDLNYMAEQNPFQPTQNFLGLLSITNQSSLSETGSQNEQQQQLSLSQSPSLSLITQTKQRQQPSQKLFLFVTDLYSQFIKGVQQSKYIPVEEAANRLPLLSEDHKIQVKIKVYTGQTSLIHKQNRIE
ncbi:MAG: hypothetical protein EZS28_037512 [Streblomastix strix]|uniref:Uncharacterized protein n=1 Tax=Streblomastix strix TaxID=222440 RepID=A0A5J4UAM4_9EUKA|nr:MAG: hypothetical protein EZS28_037512 [Streblomastix strix]